MQMVKDDIGALVDEQKKLEGAYENVMTERAAGQGHAGSATRAANRTAAHTASRDLSNSTNVMTRNLKQNPLTMDNLSKVQEDRYVDILSHKPLTDQSFMYCRKI